MIITFPNWLKAAIVGIVIGSIGTAYIFIRIVPPESSDKDLTPTISFPSNNINQNLKTVKILVRDSKSDILLSEVKIEMVTKEEVIEEKTFADGSFTVQIPQQELGEVYLSLRKSGYKPILKKPINLLVDPNKPRTFYLEPDESQANPPLK